MSHSIEPWLMETTLQSSVFCNQVGLRYTSKRQIWFLGSEKKEKVWRRVTLGIFRTFFSMPFNWWSIFFFRKPGNQRILFRLQHPWYPRTSTTTSISRSFNSSLYHLQQPLSQLLAWREWCDYNCHLFRRQNW